MVAFVDIDPLGPDAFATGFRLLRPRYNLVHTHVAEELHLDGAAFSDECWVKAGARHIVTCRVDPVLDVQRAELVK